MAGLAIAAGMGLLKGGIGAAQYFSARNELKELGDAPDYEIPTDVREQLSESKNRIVGGLPAESRRLFSENILSGQAQGLNQLSSRKAGLMGVAQADQTATGAMNQVLMQDANERIRQQEMKRQAVERARAEMIAQQETVYQENLAGYTDERNRLEAAKGAGMQNIVGAFGDVASAGVASLGSPAGAPAGTTPPPAPPAEAAPPVGRSTNAPLVVPPTASTPSSPVGLNQPSHWSFNSGQGLPYPYPF